MASPQLHTSLSELDSKQESEEEESVEWCEDRRPGMFCGRLQNEPDVACVHLGNGHYFKLNKLADVNKEVLDEDEQEHLLSTYAQNVGRSSSNIDVSTNPKSTLRPIFRLISSKTNLPALIDAFSGTKGDNPVAIRSAFIKFSQLAYSGKNRVAKVVFPDPLGPAIM